MSGKSDIIFASLPAYLDFVARALRWLGHDVYYINLSAPTPEQATRRASSLRDSGIVPLPLESAPRLTGVRKHFTDPGGKLDAKVDRLVPPRLLDAVGKLFPANERAAAKLRLAVRTGIASLMNIPAQANLWARTHTERRHRLVFAEASGYFAFGLEPNVRVTVIPIGTVVEPFARVIRRARIGRTSAAPRAPSGPARSEPQRLPKSGGGDRVALVTHKGMSYGDLFQKELYYSTDVHSPLHPSALLHFDYSGFPSPSTGTRWVQLRGRSRSAGAAVSSALGALARGLGSVRRSEQLFGLMLLARFRAKFDAFSHELESYPDLEIALIDFEILCPKTLLMAFEARGIKTVATQERFFLSFYAVFGTILDTYLCASDYVVPRLKSSRSYSVVRYRAVGQYRSDNLVARRALAAPGILKGPMARGKKIVTALGFHTHLEWFASQSDPLLNWTAQLQFLEDMLRLSSELPGVFLVLRFKFVDWISLPVFADVMRRIEASDSISVSTAYDAAFFSYDLCAHSQLVIAKHTSLGDECLAVGIPVLFHDYTHNTERLVSDAFDYSPARVMCYSYDELLRKARVLLSDAAPELRSDLEYLKANVFGGLGDGNVSTRIHAEVARMLDDASPAESASKELAS